MRLCLALLVLSGCGPWGTAKRINTVESYADYRAAYPDSPHAEDAHRRAHKLLWSNAESDGLSASYKAYLYAHPDGEHAAKATIELDHATFREAKTRTELISYLHSYPKGKHTEDAATALDELAWTEATKGDNPRSYAAYITQNPDGAHLEKASEIRDGMLWKGVIEKDLIAGYRRYLEDHPTTRYSPDARARIEALTFDRVRIVLRLRKTWRPEPMSLVTNAAAQLKRDFVRGLVELGFHKDIPIEAIDGTRGGEQIHPLDAFPVEPGTGLFLIDLEETKGENLDSGYATVITARVEVYASGRRGPMSADTAVAETEAYVPGSSQTRLNQDAEKRLGTALMGAVDPLEYKRTTK